MKHSLTVMIPGYNEEKNIENAIDSVLKEVKKRFSDFEIIVIDDGSKDKTGEIVDRAKRKDKRIKVIHNNPNKGLGYNYMKAVELASKEYFTWFPGDNENSDYYFGKTLDLIGKADIIVPYPINTEVRKGKRRFISKAFVNLINLLFGLRVKYYNGLIVYKSDILKKVNITTFGFAYSAETLVKLLRQGYNYTEVGIKIKPITKSTIFRIKNIKSVIKTIFTLFYEVNIRGFLKYGKRPKLIK